MCVRWEQQDQESKWIVKKTEIILNCFRFLGSNLLQQDFHLERERDSRFVLRMESGNEIRLRPVKKSFRFWRWNLQVELKITEKKWQQRWNLVKHHNTETRFIKSILLTKLQHEFLHQNLNTLIELFLQQWWSSNTQIHTLQKHFSIYSYTIKSQMIQTQLTLNNETFKSIWSLSFLH